MAHAVKRIMFCTADTKKHLFVMVAKNPETGSEGVYSHVFLTSKKEQVSTCACMCIHMCTSHTALTYLIWGGGEGVRLECH